MFNSPFKSIEDSYTAFDSAVKKIEKTVKVNSPILDIPNDFVEFNKLIGLPKHPYTLESSPMMPWQMDFFMQMVYEKSKKMGRSPLKVHENKARQIGATDNMQRFFAFHGSGRPEHRDVHWYVGKKIINIAGTREKTSKKIQARLRALFNNIENQIADNGTDLWFQLKNGTEYESLPSNSEAIRGDTKIGAIGVDEAAHFHILDDSVVIDSIIPIVDTNLADLFLLSTPNGKRGFFYDIDMQENDFIKFKHSIFVTDGFLHTKERIEEILKRTNVDVDQEYLNKYTTSHTAIITDAMLDEVRDDEHKSVDLSKIIGKRREMELDRY